MSSTTLASASRPSAAVSTSKPTKRSPTAIEIGDIVLVVDDEHANSRRVDRQMHPRIIQVATPDKPQHNLNAGCESGVAAGAR